MPPAIRALVCALISLVSAPAAFAAPAGTVISNTATFRFEMDGGISSGTSNTVSLTVARRLDVAVVADLAVQPAAAGGTDAVKFVVSNTGNGSEAIDLSATLDLDGAVVRGIAVDRDGNGTYDPAVDTSLGSDPLVLDPGANARVFVLVEGVTAQADVALTARVSPGPASREAVVGPNGGSATARTVLTTAASGPSLVKSQDVLAPDGTARAVKGAVITYNLAAQFPAAAGGVEIEDAIPAGTSFIPGSMTLDGTPLSDTSDGDAGRFDGNSIRVALGTVEAAGNRVVRFQVKIQ